MKKILLFCAIKLCVLSISAQKLLEKIPISKVGPQLNVSDMTTNSPKHIRSIYQDKNGNFWIGTNDAGVFLYDLKTLTQYTIKDGLADNQISYIQEDNFGNLWFESGNFKISKFDGKQFSIETNLFKPDYDKNQNWNYDVLNLWFCSGDGVFRYNGKNLDHLAFTTLNAKQSINNPFKLTRYGVYTILEDKEGQLWIGTQAEGVCKFDGDSLVWFKEKGLAGPAILGIFQDSKGTLWFGTNGSGLFCYDGQQMSNFTEEKNNMIKEVSPSHEANNKSLSRIYSINEDQFGHIWIGTINEGVWKFDGRKLIQYTTENGLTSNSINTIYKDKNGELWFGTDSHGICKFNGISFLAFNFF